MFLCLPISCGVTQVPEVLLQDFDDPNKSLLVGLQGFLRLQEKVEHQWGGFGTGTSFPLVLFDLQCLRHCCVCQCSTEHHLLHGPRRSSCELRMLLWEVFWERHLHWTALKLHFWSLIGLGLGHRHCWLCLHKWRQSFEMVIGILKSPCPLLYPQDRTWLFQMRNLWCQIIKAYRTKKSNILKTLFRSEKVQWKCILSLFF